MMGLCLWRQHTKIVIDHTKKEYKAHTKFLAQIFNWLFFGVLAH